MLGVLIHVWTLSTSMSSYCRNVLKRIVAVIRFLASRGLAFRMATTKLWDRQKWKLLGFSWASQRIWSVLGTTSKSIWKCRRRVNIILIGQHLWRVHWTNGSATLLWNSGGNQTVNVLFNKRRLHSRHLTHWSADIYDLRVERFMAFIPIFSHGAESGQTTLWTS